MSFGTMLKKVRLEKGYTQDQLARIVNTSRSNIANYEVDKNMPSIEMLHKLSEVLNVSTDILLEKKQFNEKQPTNVLKDLLIIPVVGKIRAGEPILAEENIEDNFFISASMYNLHSPDGLFFLKVIGNSMNNVIPEGGYALIRQQDTAENGDVVVAIVNGNNEATLKRFKQINDTIIILEPDSTNPDYKEIIIDLTKTDFKIIGKVIGEFKRWN